MDSKGDLYEVCDCKESRVHKKCLETWRHQKAINAYAIPMYNNFNGVERCEVCMSPYRHIDSYFTLTQKARKKFILLVVRDLVFLFTLLGVCYYVFGWNAPLLWSRFIKGEPSDGQRFCNGVIWTHAIITIMFLISSSLCSVSYSRQSNNGCCFCWYCWYCPGVFDCEKINTGNSGEACVIIALVLCILFAVFGIFMSIGFIMNDIIHKHKLQMQAELYLNARFEVGSGPLEMPSIN